MKYRVLGITDKRQFGADVMVVVDYTDIAAMAGAGAALNIIPSGTGTIPAGTKVLLQAMVLQTPFASSSDAGINSCAIIVGDHGGTTNRFLTSTELAAAGAYVTYSIGSGTKYMFTAAGNIDLTPTVAGGGALAASITSGAVALYFSVENVNDLPQQ